jgi:hypothetical protein
MYKFSASYNISYSTGEVGITDECPEGIMNTGVMNVGSIFQIAIVKVEVIVR